MGDERIRRSSLVQEVVERIGGMIHGGGLVAHDRLPTEMELVGRLGVSRTVVREAVKRLETMGLVTIERGRGTYVASQDTLMNCARLVRTAMTISSGELAQFIELRAAIEYYAVRQAAQLATPEEVDELASLCEEMTREGQNPAEARRLDLQLHLRFVEIAGVKLMRDVMEIIQEFVWEGMQRTWPNRPIPGKNQTLHMTIIDAIRAHDPDAAEEALRAHMDLLFLRLHEQDPHNGVGVEEE